MSMLSLKRRVKEEQVSTEQQRPFVRRVPEAVRAYAPPSTEPIKLANATIESVLRIGSHAAEELDQIANAIERGAKGVADEVRDLAAKIRSQAENKAIDVSDFCTQSTMAISSVRELQNRLMESATEQLRREAEKNKTGGEETLGDGEETFTDDGQPMPKFLNKKREPENEGGNQ